MKRIFFIFMMLLTGCCCLTACKKLVAIQPPVGDLVATQVFASDDEATSAVAGIYSGMINSNFAFASSGITILAGMSADELLLVNHGYNPQLIQFQDNDLSSSNGVVNSNLWFAAFQTIYRTNAIIGGLTATEGVHDSLKSELIGEAEFVRAFCNFYLVNLFGDIPLVTTINYQKNGVLSRMPVALVYNAIIGDLKDAQQRLATDYSSGQGQRIIPTKWAATALLARVYLYTGDWQDAEAQSTAVINNTSLFSLLSDPSQVFLANSMEAIWQLQQSNTTSPSFNVVPEAYLIIPAKLNSNLDPPFVYMTSSLLQAFDSGDLRQALWIDSTNWQNRVYYFPFKYHAGKADVSPNGYSNEYYMVLRLAEQFLIRAESETWLGQDSAAVNDLNTIRTRAGLPGYQGPTDQNTLLQAVLHERQVELFAEWGNRWLDLKRTKQAETTLSNDKGFSVSTQMLLYPLPATELKVDPNLTQNPGYQ